MKNLESKVLKVIDKRVVLDNNNFMKHDIVSDKDDVYFITDNPLMYADDDCSGYIFTLAWGTPTVDSVLVRKY